MFNTYKYYTQNSKSISGHPWSRQTVRKPLNIEPAVKDQL